MAQHPHFPQPDRYPFNLPPESPDSITMSGLARPADVGMRGFGQYASLPGHGQSPAELMCELHALASGHSQQGFMGTSGLIMNQFIRDRAGPWNPVDAEKRLPAGISFNSQDFPNFSVFRNNPPPSEADTVSQSIAGIFSDSGYGSIPIQSVGNPSIHGDVDQSVEASLLSRLQAMGQENVSPDEPRRRESRGQRSTVETTGIKGLICPDCKAILKTNSELKKHQARHNRPFKCHVAGCAKGVEGFSTNNDLERHKLCVHKILPVTGDVTIYRCNLGQCKDKPKDWPRQDNFRQHLRRKHKLEVVDLTPFTFRISGTTDLVRFASAGVGPSEEAVAAGSVSASQSTWTGFDYSHISSDGFSNGDSQYAQTGSMATYPSQSAMAGNDPGSSEAATTQYRVRDHQESAHHRPDMEPALPEPSVPRPLPQEANGRGMEHLANMEMDPPTCVAPNDLSHGRTESKTLEYAHGSVQPGELVQPDVYESPAQLRDDAQSEVGELGSMVPDDMDVDGPTPDSASEDGDGSDSEDGETAHGTADTQSIILRNAGAQYVRADEVYIEQSPSQVKLGEDASQPIELDDETHASAVIESLIKKGKLSEILKRFGYSAPEDAENREQKPSVTSSAASDSGHVHKCQECPKTFPRPCELKKHQKRHAKPYACTFARCNKRFGSKNDWKRHENSQHFQLEIWRCAEKMADRLEQPDCGKVCHRRESLKSHFEKDHQIRDPAVIEKKLAECRMGRNFESRFWCGFCQKTIEPTRKGGPAHGERFDHIDDHFNGRGVPKADIKEWKHVDTDPVDSPENSPGKGKGSRSGSGSRKRAHEEGADGGASRAKRLKESSGKVVFWTCCYCNNYWRKRTTPSCLTCYDHALCDNCKLFEDDGSPEPEVPTHAEAQDQAEDGLMT